MARFSIAYPPMTRSVPFIPGSRTQAAFTLALFLGCLASGISADFDGDGVADDFAIIRDASKEARADGIKVANPFEVSSNSKQKPKGLGLRVRLSRKPQTYLLHDAEFFSTPMWTENKAAAKVITKKDSGYRAWKK